RLKELSAASSPKGSNAFRSSNSGTTSTPRSTCSTASPAMPTAMTSHGGLSRPVAESSTPFWFMASPKPWTRSHRPCNPLCRPAGTPHSCPQRMRSDEPDDPALRLMLAASEWPDMSSPTAIRSAPVAPSTVSELAAIVGAENVLHSRDELLVYECDGYVV